MAQNCSKRQPFRIGSEKEQELTEQQIQMEIDKYMASERVQWASFAPGSRKREYSRPPKEDDVPLVSVCVEGGLGTISTVLEAVKNGVLSVMVVVGGGRLFFACSLL